MRGSCLEPLQPSGWRLARHELHRRRSLRSRSFGTRVGADACAGCAAGLREARVAPVTLDMSVLECLKVSTKEHYI